jgi:hypothetical protein
VKIFLCGALLYIFVIKEVRQKRASGVKKNFSHYPAIFEKYEIFD